MISLIFTIIFLFVTLSYYLLLLLPKKFKEGKGYDSLTVIIPAHNEERYLKKSIESVVSARFKGEKEIIVIDDGSYDKTLEIIDYFHKKGLIKKIITKHIGKAESINLALKKAKGQAIAIVDGDSYIEKDSLEKMSKHLSVKGVGAATGVIKVANRTKFFCIWFHIEQLYNSLIRSIFTKINANVVTPGPLSMYDRKALDEVGGFSSDGFSEDVDVTIRLVRKNYKVVFSDAVSATNLPYKFKWVFLQRLRFSRGMVRIFRKHLKINSTLIDIYTLPILFFTYFQGIVMGSLQIYNIISGYIQYFLSQGVYFNFEVFKFLINWFSIMGFFRWMISILSGNEPLTFIAGVGIISTLLTYPLYFIAIFKFDKKIDLLHLFALFFMAPFWLFVMLIYVLAIPDFFKKEQYNIWRKETK
jgi:cellulose synthase/poly-beta-1,6-N-acetylglucosamine synthase-like glycosyltransferase